MRAAVITFPGSNCDRDLAVAMEKVFDRPVQRLWHGESSIPDGLDLIGVPGGFSYGDYLRSGAMAARSPIMKALVDQAQHGTAILGICNGFQVLTESGLLPGALMRNAGMHFVCRPVSLIVENAATRFTSGYTAGQTITVPVAHHDGNYFADEDTISRLNDSGQIAFRYAEAVNGSAHDIAGITNAEGNVLGMMPHPERAIEAAQGGTDGRTMFESLLRDIVSPA